MSGTGTQSTCALISGRPLGYCTQPRAAAAAREDSITTEEEIVQPTICIMAAALALAALPAIAQGTDPNLARNLAATCANCHGTNGAARGDSEPLAGARKEDLVRKLQDFKTGRKPATIMHQLAKGYTDDQLELIAGWFAAQKPAT
jgi:sulfide dehydrogenase cytochrome subunit